MDIIISVSLNSDIWEKELSKFHHSIFITPVWVKSVSGPLRIPVFFDFKLEGKTIAKIAGLTIQKHKLAPKILFFYSGISYLDSKKHFIEECKKKLVEYAENNNYSRIVLRSYDYNNYFLSKIKKFKIHNRYEYKIDLTADKEVILKRFNKSKRYRIRKAFKEGSKAYETTSGAYVEKLIKFLLNTQTIRKTKGYTNYSFFYMPYFDKQSLKYLLKNGHATIFYVKTHNKINCMRYILTSDKKAYALLIGTNSYGYKMGSPSFIQYQTAVMLKERGFTSLNLGGVPSGPSSSNLIQYKRSFGSVKFEMPEESTNYLNYPYKLLNPFLNIERVIPENKFTRIVKKIIRKFIKMFVTDYE